MTVPDEAVEAAARVHYEAEMGVDWGGALTSFKRGYLDDARRMLEAAAPFIAAQAWDAAVASLEYPDGSKVEVAANHNPYRSGT